MLSKRGTFDPEGPLWDTLNGVRHPTWSCPLCNGGFDERGGMAVAWVSKYDMLSVLSSPAGGGALSWEVSQERVPRHNARH